MEHRLAILNWNLQDIYKGVYMSVTLLHPSSCDKSSWRDMDNVNMNYSLIGELQCQLSSFQVSRLSKFTLNPRSQPGHGYELCAGCWVARTCLTRTGYTRPLVNYNCKWMMLGNDTIFNQLINIIYIDTFFINKFCVFYLVHLEDDKSVWELWNQEVLLFALCKIVG